MTTDAAGTPLRGPGTAVDPAHIMATTAFSEPSRRLMKFFEYDHLQEPLRGVSMLFHALAWQLVRDVPESAERTVGLRKLLEAKDCCVRAMLP